MKKILFFLVLMGSLLNAKTLVVDNDPKCVLFICQDCKGNIITPFYFPYSKVQDAINDANAGDIIEICNGQYDESVLIPDNKNGLTLKAAEDDPDVIIKSSDKGISVSQNTKGLTLENIKIFSKKDGVYFNGNAGDVNFTNVVIQNENGYILYTKNPPANSLNIDNSTLISKDGGIKFSTNNGVSITDSNITAFLTTIDTSGTLKIQNSEINSTSSNALTFKSSNNPKIDNSTINAEDYGIYLYNINDWQITNTTIHSNSKYAIYADGGNNNFKMDSIHISGNKGAYIRGGSGGKILNSCFTGITNDGLVGSHDQLTVKDNCFINIGGYEANFSGNNLNFNGNYWEDKDWAGGVNDTEPLNSCPNDCDNSSENLNQCFFDNFNRSELGDKWKIIKSKNYTPNIQNGKLYLTNNSKAISSGVTLIGKFPAKDNYVIVEFEENAYGKSGTEGADGVAVVLSNASVDPVAGAFGGSLGYAPKDTIACDEPDGCPGFAGGWLGIGLDEYGNFSNPTEGREEGPGRKPDSVAIRGKGNGLKGYKYIGGTESLSPGIDDNWNYNNNENNNIFTSNSALHYKYKIVIDTRNNKTLIKVYRDTGNGYELLIKTDASSNGEPPEYFKLSLTGSTGDANNYHTFDDINISALDCGTLGQQEETKTYKFDAWDTFRDETDKNISTKIVNKEFNLTLAEYNGSAYNDDFNGTVCSILFDEDTKNKISEWNATYWRNNDDINKTNISFKVTKAVKKAKVYMYWIENSYETNDSCRGLFNHENNETNSTDNFAIRPERFSISISSSHFYAGEDFNITFKALDNSGKPSEDYNESKSANSFEVNATEIKSGCITGTFNLSDFNFSNGIANNVDANYSEVGEINITLKEINGSEFANVDSDDTNDSDRLITPYTKQIIVNPYEINVTEGNLSGVFDPSSSRWIYMDSNLSELNVTANVTISVNNKQHQTLYDFNSSCYAKDINVTFYYDVNNTNSDVNLTYEGNLANFNKSIGDINKTLQIPASHFTTNGETNESYSFNIDRNISNPLNPVYINLKEINITGGNAKNKNAKTIESNATFYYGNLALDDVVTTKNEFNKTFNFILYDENESDTLIPNGAKEIKYNWYENLYHQKKDGDVNESEIVVSRDYKASNAISGVDVSVDQVEKGVITFKISRNDSNVKFAVIHLLSPNLKWLWYSKFGDEYNVSDDSSCLNHFCFTITWQNADQTGEVGSGDFHGTEANVTDTNSTKRGVKIFR